MRLSKIIKNCFVRLIRTDAEPALFGLGASFERLHALGVWMGISVARRAVAAQMARLAFQKKKHNVFPRISWRSWCARRYLTSN